MKNKISFLTIILTISLSFIQTVQANDIACNNSSELNCDIYDSYRYASFGVGPIIFIPNIGIGYRERYAQLGWDTALSFSTIGYAHQLTGHWVGHCYLSPFQKNSAYMGLGVMASGVCLNKEGVLGTLSPDFVFGKELSREGNSRHFLEMHVAIPTLWIEQPVWTQQLKSEFFYLPLMYVKYGVAF